jgi:hypothetical protein
MLRQVRAFLLTIDFSLYCDRMNLEIETALCILFAKRDYRPVLIPSFMTPNLYLVLIFSLLALCVVLTIVFILPQLDKNQEAMEKTAQKPQTGPTFGYLPPRPEGKEWPVSDEKFKK